MEVKIANLGKKTEKESKLHESTFQKAVSRSTAALYLGWLVVNKFIDELLSWAPSS